MLPAARRGLLHVAGRRARSRSTRTLGHELEAHHPVGPLSLMVDSRPVHPLGSGMHQAAAADRTSCFSCTNVRPSSRLRVARPPPRRDCGDDLSLRHGPSRRRQLAQVAGGPLGGASRLCLVQYQPIRHLPGQTAPPKSPSNSNIEYLVVQVVCWYARFDTNEVSQQPLCD